MDTLDRASSACGLSRTPFGRVAKPFVRPKWLLCTLCFLAWNAALGQAIEGKRSSSKFSNWSESGFDRAYTRLLQPEEIYGKKVPAHDYILSFTAIYVDGTSWSEARALRQVRKTARILVPCGIKLSRVRLAKIWTPQGLRDIDVTDTVPASDIPRNAYQLATRLPKNMDWPAVFFVKRILGEDVLARSYQQGDVPASVLKSYPYMNTAWVSYRAHWVERPEDEYSALAHEMAHLLCRCGHQGGPRRHLLHEFRNFLGTHVLRQHCEKFRTSEMVRRRPLQ